MSRVLVVEDRPDGSRRFDLVDERDLRRRRSFEDTSVDQLDPDDPTDAAELRRRIERGNAAQAELDDLTYSAWAAKLGIDVHEPERTSDEETWARWSAS